MNKGKNISALENLKKMVVRADVKNSELSVQKPYINTTKSPNGKHLNRSLRQVCSKPQLTLIFSGEIFKGLSSTMRNGIRFSSTLLCLKKTRARQPSKPIRFITKTNRDYMWITRVFLRFRRFGCFHFVFQLVPNVFSFVPNGNFY